MVRTVPRRPRISLAGPIGAARRRSATADRPPVPAASRSTSRPAPRSGLVLGVYLRSVDGALFTVSGGGGAALHTPGPFEQTCLGPDLYKVDSYA